MIVRKITTQETLPLRQRILRHKDFPVEKCIYPGDDDATTFHLGVFRDDVSVKDQKKVFPAEILVCVATFLKEQHPDFKHFNQYRLRGMATDANIQQKGFGTAILKQA